MVAMPKKAENHIQKMAPGPPEYRAVAQPVMLPVPTWAAMAVVLPAFSPLSEKPPNTRRIPSAKPRTWMKRVRIEK